MFWFAMAINCYGVGDCLIGSQFLTASGGFRDEADEGTHPFDLQIREDSLVFQGTCSRGCTPGSTVGDGGGDARRRGRRARDGI